MTPPDRGMPFVILLALHLAADLVIAFWLPWQSWNYWMVLGLILGFLFAQVSLLAVWMALGSSNVAIRIPTALLFAAVPAMAYLIMTVRIFGDALPGLVQGVTMVVQLVAIVVPLTFVRLARRRYGRQSPPTTEEHGGSERQFGLKHVLAWTAGAALLLGIGRYGLRYAVLDVWSRDLAQLARWHGLMVAFNVCLAVPTVWVATSRLRAPFCFGVSILFAAAVSYLENLTFGVFVLGQAILFFLVKNVTHGALVVGSLRLLTWLRSPMLARP